MSGNNTAGTLTYITPAGAQVTVQGAISRRKKSGQDNEAFYFYGTGLDAGKGYLFVEPDNEVAYSGGGDVGTDSSPYLDDLNAFLATQAALPVITVQNVTVSEASPYVVFKVSVSNPGLVHYLFSPTFASGTATVGVDTVAGWQYFDLEMDDWYAGAQADIYAYIQNFVLVRVPIVNDLNPEGLETFTLSTGAITGGAVQNNGGAFGTATLVDNGSSANVFLANNNTAIPTTGTADNDGPSNTPTAFAGAMSGYGIKNTVITRTLLATDVDGLTDGTYFTVTASPAHGAAIINAATGVWSFTPVTGYLGADSFTVTVTDDLGGTSTQVISVYVHPVVSWITWLSPGSYPNINPNRPVGIPAYTYATTTTGAITLPDGTQATTTFTGEILGYAGASGFLTSGNSYWSGKNYGGTTYISANVPELPPNSDRLALSGAAVATQTLTFDKPVANLVMNIWSMGNPTKLGSYQFTQPFVILSRSTEYGPDSLSASGNTLNGFEGSGTIQFTGTFTNLSWTVPAAEFYSVWNVGVTALQAPQGATITGDISGTGLEDNAISGTLAATDPDGLTDGTYFTVSANPANGTASINATTGAWTYTPDANYYGSDSFTVTVTDDAGSTTTQVITLTVTPVSDAPVVTLSSAPGGVVVDDFSIALDYVTSFNRTIGGQEFVFSVTNGTMSTDLAQPEVGVVIISSSSRSPTPVTIRRVDNGAFNLESIKGISLWSAGSTFAAYRAGNLVGTVKTLAQDTTPPFERVELSFGGVAVDEVRIVYYPGESNLGFDDLTLRLSGAPTTATYVENSAPVILDGALTVGDVDSTTLASGTVSLTANFAVGQDMLSFANDGSTMGNIVASYNATTGVLTLTSAGATATVAQWQAALRAVSYYNTSEAPSTLARTVSFTVNDGALESVVATMTVTVTPVNDAPVAGPQSVTTDEDTAKAITLAGTDVENSALTYTVVSGPTNGTLSGTAPALIYTPNGNFNGGDSFTFTVNDGAMDSAPATVTMNITPVNDAPVLAVIPPQTTLEEASKTVDLSAADVDSDPLTYTATSGDPNVTVTVVGTLLTLTPVTNWHGTVTITVTVSDGNGGTDTKTFTLMVTPVNDAPVVTLSGGPGATAVETFDSMFGSTSSFSRTIGGQAFVFSAVGGSMETAEYGVTIMSPGYNPTTVTIRRVDNGQFSLESIKGTSIWAGGSTVAAYRGGSLVGLVRTVPTDTTSPFDGVVLDFGGAVVDEIRIVHFGGESATAFDDLTIRLPGGPLVAGYVENSAPLVLDGTLTVGDIDSPTLASATVSLAGNFSAGQDVLGFGNDGSTMGNIVASYNATTGVLTLDSAGATATVAQWQAALRAVAYYNTSDAPSTLDRTVSFAVNDGELDSNVATMTVTVTPVNDAPVAGAQSVTTDEGTALAITLAGTDLENSALTYTVVSGPTNGTLSGTAPALIYTPNGNFNGGDSFTFTVNDGTADSEVVTVSITVTPVNDAPVVVLAIADFAAAEDAPEVVANLALHFSDVETPAGALTYAVVGNTYSALVGAALTEGTNLVLAFAPDGHGVSQISVSATDAEGLSVTNTFVVTVVPVNDAPDFVPGANQRVNYTAGIQTVPNWATGIKPGPANETEQAVQFNLSTDNLALFSQPPTLSSGGELTYTPNGVTHGVAHVTVRLQDGGGTADGGVDTSAPRMFTVTLNGPPVVDIVNPANGSQFVGSNNITVVAEAGDPDSTVTNVQIFAGTNLIGDFAHAPYFVVRTNVPAGAHSFFAVATDDLGLSTTSSIVNITVLQSPPVIAFGPFVLNRQTGLFEQNVRVTNPTLRDFPNGVLVLVSNLPPTNFVWNANGTNNGVPYVRTFQSLPAGSNVTLLIQYYVPNPRTTPNPTLIAQVVPYSNPVVPPPVLGILSASGPGFQFTAATNQMYYVQHSDNLAEWVTLPGLIRGAGTPVPLMSSPTAPQKFFRVLLLP